MFQKLKQISFWGSRALIRSLVTRRVYLAVWILSRCLPSRPIYRLLPRAYLLSATLSVAVATVMITSLAIIAWNVGWWISAFSLFALFVFRAHLDGIGFAGKAPIIGLLVLLPNPEFGFAIRFGLSATSCMIGLMNWWEKRLHKNQFHFKPVYLSNINEGSASVLRGEVHVVHLFVDTNNNRPWKLKQRRAVRTNAALALSWLVSQADRYKVDLRFVEHSVASVPTWNNFVPVSSTDHSAHFEFGDWLFELMAEFLEHQTTKPGPNVCFLVHVNQELRSYAAPQYRLHDPFCKLEYAVIGLPQESPTIAHELLHLFGADDFYLGAYWGNDCREPALRKQLLDRCIMFKTSPGFSESRVDDLTAQNIGWL